MKLFGDFLVEQNIISEEVLVKALIEQTKSIPTVPEIIKVKGLLSDTQINSVFREQVKSKSSFVEAAFRLDLWTDSIGSVVERQQAVVKTPLGELLVRLGNVNIEQISKALDEYLGSMPTDIIEKPGGKSKDLSMDFSTTPAAQPGGLEIVSDTLSDDYFKKIEVSLKLNEIQKISMEQLDQFLELVRIIRGAFKLCSCNRLDRGLKFVEDIGTEIKTKNLEVSTDSLKKFVEGTHKYFLALFSGKSLISKCQNEAEVLQETSFLTSLKDMESILFMTKFDFGMSVEGDSLND